jgi:hypothetical protein
MWIQNLVSFSTSPEMYFCTTLGNIKIQILPIFVKK